MPVTMREVAAEAGVSIKTVSNVINDYPHVRPEMRARVEAAVAKLGYRVNVTARNLRQGRTGLIGLAVSEISLPYFAELADAVIRAGLRSGVDVLIEQTDAVRDREIEALTGARRQMTDGLILSPLGLGPDEQDLLRVDFPLVILGERIFGAPVDHVTMSNVAASRAATEHLISLGRRRIAVLGAHPWEQMDTAVLRLQGYRAALDAAGLPFDPELVRPMRLWHRETGAQLVEEMVEDGVDFDAVFALNDALGIGALRALYLRGLRVPEDVAIIGFDDVQDAAYTTPSLSTVAPGTTQIAETAVAMLVERIAGVGPAEPRYLEADYRVIARESTVGPALAG